MSFEKDFKKLCSEIPAIFDDLKIYINVKKP